MKKISFYTLGCKVNQYETQAMKEAFIKDGFEVVGENEFADIYVVNSCTVTGTADKKTRQFLRKSKKQNPEALTVLVGCYSETGLGDVEKIDEVDVIMGTANKSQLLKNVKEELKEKKRDKQIRMMPLDDSLGYDDMGIITSMEDRTRAFIKIEDGCDRYCSYCVIPYARGKVRSRSSENIIEEAKSLIDNGFKEIVLTGINTALYGRDKDEDILDILKKLDQLKGDFRIRLSSLEPTVINAEYARELVKIKRLCPHLHLSMQSGSNRILKSMNRSYSREDYLDIVKVLREYDPNYSITTDIIVGFPGETDEDFDDSLRMVEEVGFSRVHAFKYSKRPNTKASDFLNQISPQIKNERSDLLINVGNRVSEDFLKKNLGDRRRVLFYEKVEDSYRGITDNYIDVVMKSEGDLENKFETIFLDKNNIMEL